MALIIDKEKNQPCVIGVNTKGELGLGDTVQRKTFTVQSELRKKKLMQCDIGKSGFVVAVSGDVIQPPDISQMMEIRKDNINAFKTLDDQSNAASERLDSQMDQRIVKLENELKRKSSIIRDGDRKHNEMLEKLKLMENRINLMA